MVNIREYLRESLDTYFEVLNNIGYVNENTMQYLIILSFIEDLTGTAFFEYITNEDLNILLEVLYKISCKSCILGAPYTPTLDDLFRGPLSNAQLRGTQQQVLKITQNSNLRQEA